MLDPLPVFSVLTTGHRARKPDQPAFAIIKRLFTLRIAAFRYHFRYDSAPFGRATEVPHSRLEGGPMQNVARPLIC